MGTEFADNHSESISGGEPCDNGVFAGQVRGEEGGGGALGKKEGLSKTGSRN